MVPFSKIKIKLKEKYWAPKNLLCKSKIVGPNNALGCVNVQVDVQVLVPKYNIMVNTGFVSALCQHTRASSCYCIGTHVLPRATASAHTCFSVLLHRHTRASPCYCISTHVLPRATASAHTCFPVLLHRHTRASPCYCISTHVLPRATAPSDNVKNGVLTDNFRNIFSILWVSLLIFIFDCFYSSGTTRAAGPVRWARRLHNGHRAGWRHHHWQAGVLRL